MKFTEEQAVEALRAELTNKGRKTLHMTEQTLTRQVDFFIKLIANDEIGLPEFVQSMVESLNIYEGDARKKNSVFAKYKEEHPDTKNPDEPLPPKDETSPELKAALERIAALEKDKIESEKRVSIANKKKDLTSKLKAKGIEDDEWMDNLLSEVNITEDFNVESKVDTYVKLYNKSLCNTGGAPAPKNPTGAPANDFYAKSVKAAASLAKNDRARIEINK